MRRRLRLVFQGKGCSWPKGWEGSSFANTLLFASGGRDSFVSGSEVRHIPLFTPCKAWSQDVMSIMGGCLCLRHSCVLLWSQHFDIEWAALGSAAG